jgi:2-pyrone-4,6-dicarboxylate lactonase
MNNPVRTYLENPSASGVKLPAKACDTHVHVFGPAQRFPFDVNRKSTPVDAPKEGLFALHKKYGIERCLIVQSVIHGFDNRVVEDAIEAGGGAYLGVALVPLSVSDQELRRLSAAGFRGVRFHFMKHIASANPLGEVIHLTHRLAEVGMHLQVHFESELIHELAPEFKKSAVPVVIDHMGRVDATLGENHSDIQAICKLLESSNIHVKISGIDRIDAHASPASRYTAGVRIARMLAAHFPNQCLWGTDWPHPNHTHIPDDGALFDALPLIAPEAQLLEQILVHNPQKLYNFPL